MTSFSQKLFHSFDQSLDKTDRLKNDLHFVIRKGSDFSRKPRKLSFKDTIMLILSMAAKPIREELLDYFDFSFHSPTASAFVQARSKISPDAFRFLFIELNRHFPTTKAYMDLIFKSPLISMILILFTLPVQNRNFFLLIISMPVMIF